MADDLQLAEATQPLSFAEFLERMKDPRAADLVKSIKIFIKEFDNKPPDPEQDSQRVQDFLLKSEAAFRAHPVWASSPGEHQQQAIEGLEKYLMTKLYGKVFAASESDRERDEALACRMEALSFVRAEHLDIPAGHRDHTAWLLAMKELHKLNNYKAPRDKLVCILNCCRVINNLLHVGHDGDARGADDFLPVLIYVLIHANPPQLASNLMYIERFRMHSRMMSESAYFFTQLYSAASFIETINSGSLSMDPDEFVARMVAAGVADLPAASPRASSQPTSSPAFAASAAENGAVLPPPAGQLPHPPGVSTAGGHLGKGRPEFQSPRAPPAPLSSVVSLGAAEPGLSPANSQQGFPGLSPMPGQPAATSTAAPAAAAGQAQAPLPQQQQQLPPPPLPQASAVPTAWRAASVAELEAEGGPLLVAAAQAGFLAVRHPFLHAAPGDLRVGDVAQLLTAYKEAVLRYEALSLAVSARASAAATAAATAAAAPMQLPAAPAPPPPEQPGAPQPTLVPPPPLAAVAMQLNTSAAAPVQPPAAQAPVSPVTFDVPMNTPTPSEASAADASVAPLQPPEQQQAAAPVDNPIFTAGTPATAPAGEPYPAQQPSEGASAAAAAAGNIQDGELTDYPTLPAEETAAAAADAVADMPPQADSAAESPQFIAAAAATAAPVPDTQPAVSAAEGAAIMNSIALPGVEQSSAVAAPSDSVRSIDGSAVEADMGGAAGQGSPRDGLAAAAAALPEAADDEEAELAALEAELAAERAAVSTPVSEAAVTSEGPGSAVSEEPSTPPAEGAANELLAAPQEQNDKEAVATELQPAEPSAEAAAASEAAPSPAEAASEAEPPALDAAPAAQQAASAEDVPADPVAAVATPSKDQDEAGDMHSSGEAAQQPQGGSMFEGLDMALSGAEVVGAAAPDAAGVVPDGSVASAAVQPGGEQSAAPQQSASPEMEVPEGGSGVGAPQDAQQQGDSLI